MFFFQTRSRKTDEIIPKKPKKKLSAPEIQIGDLNLKKPPRDPSKKKKKSKSANPEEPRKRSTSKSRKNSTE